MAQMLNSIRQLSHSVMTSKSSQLLLPPNSTEAATAYHLDHRRFNIKPYFAIVT